jgi:tetratricopeptide (TPR) repeat protein
VISAKVFNDAFRYQVNQLGNVVRGLEMIAEHLEQDWSHGAYQALAKDCRRLLAHIPRRRLSSALVTRLRALSLLSAQEDAGTQDPSSLRQSPAHAVLLLLVDQHPQSSGLVRELWVEPAQAYAQRQGFPSEAEDDFRQALVAGCRAAGQALEQAGIPPICSIPEDYVFHITPGAFGDNPRLQERSGWLASALSYFALWGGLVMPGVIAATGFLEPNGQIGALRGVTEKIAACLRERPDVEKILVLSREAIPDPDGRDPRVILVGSLEDTVQAVWGAQWRTRLVPPKPSVYAAVDKALYTYGKEGNFPEALTRFDLLSRFFAQAPQFPPRYRFLCDWRRASCHTHLGRPDRASPLFQQWVSEAEALWREGDISSEDYANFFASYGVYLQDVFAFAQGVGVLRNVLDQLAEHRVTRLQQAKLIGTQGQLLMFQGDFAAAEHALQQAYKLIEEEEKPRNCTYLGQLHTHWGRSDARHYEAAQHYLEEGRRLNDAVVSLPSQRRANQIFNSVWQARLWYARGDFARAIAAAEEGLALHPLDYPGSLAWKWKGLAHLAHGEEQAGYAALQESMIFHAPYYFRESPNVRLIMQTARIELVEWCLRTGKECLNGVTFHVGEIVTTLEAFKDAHPYFSNEIATLKQWSQGHAPDLEGLCNTLRTLATKIVY